MKVFYTKMKRFSEIFYYINKFNIHKLKDVVFYLF